LPADDRGDLRHLARLAEAIQPGHQRILECHRYPRAVLACRFHHAFGQFLDEQWNTVGLSDDRGDAASDLLFVRDFSFSLSETSDALGPLQDHSGVIVLIRSVRPDS
jgi:hypothetical protein